MQAMLLFVGYSCKLLHCKGNSCVMRINSAKFRYIHGLSQFIQRARLTSSRKLLDTDGRQKWHMEQVAPFVTYSNSSKITTFTQDGKLSEHLRPDSRSSELRHKGRTGVLLINTGSPASLDVSDVREYLRRFLSDGRVVDLHPVLRFLVLNLFILRTRPKESAAAYSNIWDSERGSPLIYHCLDMAKCLQEKLGEEHYDIRVAMQFSDPSIPESLVYFRQRGIDRIVLLPLFPQYASSSTGSCIEIAYREASKVYATPYLHVVPAFYDHDAYISAYAQMIRKHLGENLEKCDHLLISFHGVPEKHCIRTDETRIHCLQFEDCCGRITQANRNCYRAQSFETARLLSKKLGLSEANYTVAFQSRLAAAGVEWIKPYTDQVLVTLAQRGIKRLGVVVPSFIADCLETLEEIGIRGKETFLEAGGEEFFLVPCLNSSPIWAEALIRILKDSCPWELKGSH
ncbi:hypothetical protein GpartN1_g7706.t1 [Galdieria partita]|uniref:Ferrochelatase n=1 Tax=Galdieria partita TaxID=83374 RepID=A0A9C7Q5C5_9RHOD|nr:hypothetical protein GpartN1_g7706.t1 [Galdieria partita]